MTTTAQTYRTNNYPGTCSACGNQVPAQAGILTRGGRGWEVRHFDGQCGPKAEQTSTAPRNVPQTTVPQGHYAIPSATGNNDLDFYRVDRPTEGRWAGYVFVKRVIGGHPDTPIRGQEQREALARIEQFGTQEAGQLYGTELGRCYVCNRTLTDELSRTLGIGPECRKHHGEVAA